MTEYERFIREAASARGIDPDTAVAVARSEGGVDEPARRGTFDTGSSWWPFQLHYGGQGYEQYGTVAGMGNGFTKLTGWQPGDPNAWRDSVRYALNRAKAGGWSPWYGAAHVGMSNWEGIDRNHPWDANAETWDYEAGVTPMPDPVYDPTTPIEPQNHDWDCAEQSTLWAMTAYGRHPSDAWMEAAMLSGGVESTEQGLLVGDGSQLAQWITEQYGEFGYHAYNTASVSFDDVRSVAGQWPVMIGGHGWGTAGHWSGVRRYDDTHDWLELANPANGYGGIAQTMTRQQFGQVAPCSMVVVQWGSGQPVPAPEPPPAPDPDLAILQQQIADLEAQVAELTQERDGYITALAYVCDNVVADGDKAQTAEAQRVREQYIGPRPA